jgi:peroxiredoxin Q/BCP
MKGAFRFLSGGLILAGLLAAPVAPAATTGTAAVLEDLKVGDQAPDFTLPGTDGKTHSLAEFKGRTVVLAWFPKAFTGG